ncbi:MAG: glutamine--fructose-6-phosphate aminotransferase, partial [Moorea sp. SIO2I5]|nr:glutamine--fructose-6-phosphate aminotransferase [Moorena sp. SIO2I5]
MCGIFGYVGTQAATEILLAGLEKLEYRGYDSAGIATVSSGNLECVRAKGRLRQLRAKLVGTNNPAQIGIGHTRWATHGKPEEHNAHPHTDQAMQIAVVQNGIIENYRELKEQLQHRGICFRSDTDTEVIPHLIAQLLQDQLSVKKSEEKILSMSGAWSGGMEFNQVKSSNNGYATSLLEVPEPVDRIFSSSSVNPFLEAVRQAVNILKGSFAIAVVCADYPNEVIIARQQAPLAIGFGQGEYFCASDIPALVPHTQVVLSLENGELARLTPLGVEVYNFAGVPLNKYPRTLSWNPVLIEKQGFKHFMLKEIHEQPRLVRASLDTYLNHDWYPTNSSEMPIKLGLPAGLLEDLEQIQIVACGSSWHAGLVGKYLLEQIAGIPTMVQYASEFRYAPPPLTANTLTIGVTQSGETADTLAALAMEQQRRSNQQSKFQLRLLGITNRTESSLAALTENIIDIHAGIEIGVAATKTYTAQLLAFYCLALDLSYRRQVLPLMRLETILNGLQQLPALMESVLEVQEDSIQKIADQFTDTQDVIFIGRGINFPVALEGALKL